MSYITAATSYSISISTFRTSCDRILVSAFAGFASNGIRVQSEISKSLSPLGKQMNTVLLWSDEMTTSAKHLEGRLRATKAKLEKEIAEIVQPKQDISFYQNSTLPTPAKGPDSGPGRRSVGSDGSSRRRGYSVSKYGKPSKQGWLFHRLTTGKPARTSWVRRWFFVKDGTFGWLQNSAKTAAVEESERVGVLLCNVRPAPQEERRFCFEVMTKSVSYMLQSETEGELGDWIQVFELAKNAVLADDKLQHPQAFAIVSPAHAEFAASQPEDNDRHGAGAQTPLTAPQTTGSRAVVEAGSPAGSSGSTQASRSIVNKIENRLKERAKALSTPTGGIASLVAASGSTIAGQHVPVRRLHVSSPRLADLLTERITGSNIAPGTLAPAPVLTQMSTRALIARSLSTPLSANVPNGIMANYWGSMNWGLVSVDEAETQSDGLDSMNQAQSSADSFYEKSVHEHSIPSVVDGNGNAGSQRSSVSQGRGHSKSTSSVDLGPGVQYPPDYPNELKKQDAQFRTLFPTTRPDDFVLLVCRVMWQPVEGQQLWGRLYATKSGLQFFAHAHGMVCVQTIPFSDIIRISQHGGVSSGNILIERDHMDPIDAKVYLDSANLISRRLDMLFRNSLSDQPMETHEIIQQIQQMEEERQSDDDDKRKDKITDVDFEVSRAPKATGGLYNDDAPRYGLPQQLLHRSGDNLHVVFPSEPVKCNCSDHLDKLFSEYTFQIPAKSLFHLMFGDSTPIWKKVYRARRVEDLEIGPWKSRNKQLVREYKYRFEYNDALLGISFHIISN